MFLKLLTKLSGASNTLITFSSAADTKVVGDTSAIDDISYLEHLTHTGYQVEFTAPLLWVIACCYIAYNLP